MDMMDELRETFGGPLIVSSAYRCPEYNNKISSTGTKGPHTTGKAIDIAINGEDAYKLVKAAVSMGFSGIGIKQKGSFEGRFIHLDMLPLGTIRPRIWSY